MTEKVILVTGASSGSGRAIASLLCNEGYRVFGTSRNPKSATLDGFEMVQLDVTDDESVKACVGAVIEKAGRIDVLVNNAGVELIGAAEEITIEEAKALFETNFFGVMRMVSVVLPHMRQRGSGMIVNIGSIAGFVAAPFQSTYAASKHALEAYSEAIALEVEPFGVEIKLVEPGYFRSDIITNAQKDLSTGIDVYDEARAAVTNTIAYRIEHGMPASKIAQVVHKIVQGRSRKMRHVVASPDLVMTIFAKAVPERLMRSLTKISMGLHPIPLIAPKRAPSQQ